MSLTIDDMSAEDIPVVARLRMDSFFEGPTRTLDEDSAGLHDLLAGKGVSAALVARRQGIVAGSVLLVPEELDAVHDLTPWLAGLVVAEAHRGKGIGAALVLALESRAASIGVDTLHLYTWEARRFYASLGWTEVETFRQDGEPMALMSRALRHILPAT